MACYLVEDDDKQYKRIAMLVIIISTFDINWFFYYCVCSYELHFFDRKFKDYSWEADLPQKTSNDIGEKNAFHTQNENVMAIAKEQVKM